jgi:hypothetical protein
MCSATITREASATVHRKLPVLLHELPKSRKVGWRKVENREASWSRQGCSVFRPVPRRSSGRRPHLRRESLGLGGFPAPHRSVLAFGSARPASPRRRARRRARSCSAAATPRHGTSRSCRCGLRASLRAAASRAVGEASEAARTLRLWAKLRSGGRMLSPEGRTHTVCSAHERHSLSCRQCR